VGVPSSLTAFTRLSQMAFQNGTGRCSPFKNSLSSISANSNSIGSNCRNRRNNSTSSHRDRKRLCSPSNMELPAIFLSSHKLASTICPCRCRSLTHLGPRQRPSPTLVATTAKLSTTSSMQQYTAMKGSTPLAYLICPGRRHQQREVPPAKNRTIVWPSGESGSSLISIIADSSQSTTPRLDRGPDRRHSRRRSMSHKSRARRLSPRSPISPDERYHKTTRRTKENPWAEGEKRCYETVMCMDELTKYHRVGYFVSRSPSRVFFESLVDRYRCKDVDIQKEVAKSTSLCFERGHMRRAWFSTKLPLS
jgi:hypothetical protein